MVLYSKTTVPCWILAKISCSDSSGCHICLHITLKSWIWLLALCLVVLSSFFYHVSIILEWVKMVIPLRLPGSNSFSSELVATSAQGLLFKMGIHVASLLPAPSSSRIMSKFFQPGQPFKTIIASSFSLTFRMQDGFLWLLHAIRQNGMLFIACLFSSIFAKLKAI